jgi:hypothetical protein
LLKLGVSNFICSSFVFFDTDIRLG